MTELTDWALGPVSLKVKMNKSILEPCFVLAIKQAGLLSYCSPSPNPQPSPSQEDQCGPGTLDQALRAPQGTCSLLPTAQSRAAFTACTLCVKKGTYCPNQPVLSDLVHSVVMAGAAYYI